MPADPCEGAQSRSLLARTERLASFGESSQPRSAEIERLNEHSQFELRLPGQNASDPWRELEASGDRGGALHAGGNIPQPDPTVRVQQPDQPAPSRRANCPPKQANCYMVNVRNSFDPLSHPVTADSFNSPLTIHHSQCRLGLLLSQLVPGAAHFFQTSQRAGEMADIVAQVGLRKLREHVIIETV